jgi:transcription elongation GreA/GreB family factor
LLMEEFKLASLEGDFSENFDRDVSWEEIQKLKRNILLLKQKISRTDGKNFSSSKLVVYQSLKNKQKKTIQLTDPLASEEEKSSFPQVSFTSPLGIALTNKKIGETSEVKTKKGNYWIKIINIKES